MRIVSLVPSLSSTICAAGLQDQLVGCTNFCVLPNNLHRTAASVGGTKDPNIEKIISLKPTHVLVNQEENSKEHVEKIQLSIPTLITFPKSPFDVPAMLTDIGRFLDFDAPFQRMAQELQKLLQAEIKHKEPMTYVYLIWRDPYMAAGSETYVSRCLETLGWKNALDHQMGRYPVIEPDFLGSLPIDALFLSSEPFPFKKRHAVEIREKHKILQHTPIRKIDGQLTQWYGDLTIELLKQRERVFSQPF